MSIDASFSRILLKIYITFFLTVTLLSLDLSMTIGRYNSKYESEDKINWDISSNVFSLVVALPSHTLS